MKIEKQRQQKIIEDYSEGMIWFEPFFPDVCNHEEHKTGTYVVSFVNTDRNGEKRFDVYVLAEGKICMRYGVEGSHYISTSVTSLLTASHISQTYKLAADILARLGYFTWVPDSPL